MRRVLAAVLLMYACSVPALVTRGYLGIEWRGFTEDALDSRQHGNNASLVAEPEFYFDWADGEQALNFVPFLRLDQGDDERTHADVRQLYWLYAGDGWELRAGVDKVFWGVTESVHLVDVINQTDSIENPDGEDKLGQPMLKYSLEHDNGSFDVFLLPYFRERTFPGIDGRLRSHPVVASNDPIYESAAEQWHLDWAARWFGSYGDWDIGLSHFSGTARAPRFVPALLGGEVRLQPLYEIIHQTSLDAQWTVDNWLVKIEAFYRAGADQGHFASATGVEYTFVGIFDKPWDLGVLAEFLWDERGERATTPFQRDVFLGARWVRNDAAGTELLAGVIADMDHSSRLFSVEASRRLGDRWKVSAEGRFFHNIDTADPTYSQRHDDYIQLELLRYF